ncbi:MAG: type IV toxin-antitoxin system AbiEi family antitoxin domain-containing protein [Candidatus Thermoplasmatota archaeon]
MPRIKYSHILDSIMKMPVFGVKDLTDRGVSRGYARQRLHNLEKRGVIRRVERGKYTSSDDPTVVAPYLTRPSYISLWSAMSIRALTTQIPFGVDVVTSRKRFNRRLDFMGADIRFHHVAPSLMFGYEFIAWNDRWRLPVAKPEKIVIDALYLRAIAPDELEGVLDAVDDVLLLEYAELCGKKRVIRTVRRLMRC